MNIIGASFACFYQLADISIHLLFILVDSLLEGFTICVIPITSGECSSAKGQIDRVVGVPFGVFWCLARRCNSSTGLQRKLRKEIRT